MQLHLYRLLRNSLGSWRASTEVQGKQVPSHSVLSVGIGICLNATSFAGSCFGQGVDPCFIAPSRDSLRVTFLRLTELKALVQLRRISQCPTLKAALCRGQRTPYLSIPQHRSAFLHAFISASFGRRSRPVSLQHFGAHRRTAASWWARPTESSQIGLHNQGPEFLREGVREDSRCDWNGAVLHRAIDHCS